MAFADWWPAVTLPSTHSADVEQAARVRHLLGGEHVGNLDQHVDQNPICVLSRNDRV